MRHYKIPSSHEFCDTEQYVIEIFEHKFSFQIFRNKIEYVSDREMFGWSRGKTLNDVLNYLDAENKNAIKIKDCFKQKLL